jgi:hypothetical protein
LESGGFQTTAFILRVPASGVRRDKAALILPRRDDDRRRCALPDGALARGLLCLAVLTTAGIIIPAQTQQGAQGTRVVGVGKPKGTFRGEMAGG